MLKEIASQYGLSDREMELTPLGSGLIHRTWKLMVAGKEFVLQEINHNVFRHPADIADNIGKLEHYLKRSHPEYLFIAPLKTKRGESFVYLNDGEYYRIFPFVKGSHSKPVVNNPQEAFEAAMQFGRFTRLLDGFDCNSLHLTIPCFHDLNLRYEQFLQSIESADRQRSQKAEFIIKKLIADSWIVMQYQSLINDPHVKSRVTHHDTKISNILFDSASKSVCVIDLDTVMPGYFLSDVGDMMRTYLSPASEDETEWNRIDIREEIYRAIVSGYCEEMSDLLTEKEKSLFFFAGQFMIYMQALRFLTDYLQEDRYYGEKFPDQNLLRAKNQLVLLEKLNQKKATLATYQPGC